MGASASCHDCWRLGLALGLTLGFHSEVRAESRSQAELTSVLSLGDLLDSDHAARSEEPPWQGLASLRRGDENRLRVALSTANAGLLPGVTTSAHLRLELGLSPAPGQANALRDASSSLSLGWQMAPRAELSLRAFPFDTNYLRLGYLHALDWGGTDAERGESIFLAHTGAVPGLQLGLHTAPAQVFVALKWANAPDALRGEQRLWGMLSGASVALLPTLRVDGSFGYFERPSLVAGGARQSFVEGASLRIVWHRQVREPELSAEPFRPPSLAEDPSRLDAEERPGLALALEGVTLVQRLRRFEQPRVMSLAPAPAAALYGSARGRTLAVHGALSWRSLAFVLRNDPRLARGETLPPSASARSELTAWLGASAMLPALHLVPSFELAVRLPAALETPSVLPGFEQTLLAGGPAGLEALPIGAGRLPVLSGRLGSRFRASASVALALFGEYQRNPNRVRLADSPSGVTRAFAGPDSLSFFVAAQARF
jgi:hypothetical protein